MGRIFRSLVVLLLCVALVACGGCSPGGSTTQVDPPADPGPTGPGVNDGGKEKGPGPSGEISEDPPVGADNIEIKKLNALVGAYQQSEYGSSSGCEGGVCGSGSSSQSTLLVLDKEKKFTWCHSKYSVSSSSIIGSDNIGFGGTNSISTCLSGTYSYEYPESEQKDFPTIDRMDVKLTLVPNRMYNNDLDSWSCYSDTAVEFSQGLGTSIYDSFHQEQYSADFEIENFEKIERLGNMDRVINRDEQYSLDEQYPFGHRFQDNTLIMGVDYDRTNEKIVEFMDCKKEVEREWQNETVIRPETGIYQSVKNSGYYVFGLEGKKGQLWNFNYYSESGYLSVYLYNDHKERLNFFSKRNYYEGIGAYNVFNDPVFPEDASETIIANHEAEKGYDDGEETFEYIHLTHDEDTLVIPEDGTYYLLVRHDTQSEDDQLYLDNERDKFRIHMLKLE